MKDDQYCPLCWNPVSPDSRHCPYCGRLLSPEDVQRQQEVSAKVDIDSRRRGGCCAVLAAAALVLVFFGLLRGFFLP
jgi:predicted amidophosphoribosyltransferase